MFRCQNISFVCHIYESFNSHYHLTRKELASYDKIWEWWNFSVFICFAYFFCHCSFFCRMQLPWKKHLHLNYIQPFSSTLFFNFSRKLRRGLPYWSYWDEYRLLDIAVLYCCRTPMLQPHQRRNKGSNLEDFLYL